MAELRLNDHPRTSSNIGLVNRLSQLAKIFYFVEVGFDHRDQYVILGFEVVRHITQSRIRSVHELAHRQA